MLRDVVAGRKLLDRAFSGTKAGVRIPPIGNQPSV